MEDGVLLISRVGVHQSARSALDDRGMNAISGAGATEALNIILKAPILRKGAEVKQHCIVRPTEVTIHIFQQRFPLAVH